MPTFKHFRQALASACLLALLVGTARADTSRQEFNAALQQWKSAGIHDYSFTFYQSCFCIGRQPIRITVKGDRVKSATNVRGGAAVKPEEVGRSLTLNEIFQQIADGYAKPADHIRLTLNKDYGYPESVYIDYYENMADEELHYSISDFTH